MPTDKLCSICGMMKALVLFPRNRLARDGYKAACKDCNNARLAKYRASPRGWAARKAHDQSDKCQATQVHYRYGLTLEEYRRVLSAPNCEICGADWGYREPVLDHCHTTNRARGALCRRCNLMLGYARDDATVLQQAILYLKQGEQ